MPETDIFKSQLEVDSKGYIITGARKALDIAKPPLKSPPYKGGEMGEVNNETIKQFNYAFPSMTSVKGIFAAGDCVDFQYRQAGTAVGMGIAAALEVEKWLEISGQ